MAAIKTRQDVRRAAVRRQGLFLFAVLLALYVLAQWLMAVMWDASMGSQRALSASGLAALAAVMAWWARPTAQESQAALLTGIVMAAGDFVYEGIMVALDVWRYHGPFMLLGLPVDMFWDFVLLGFTFSLSLALFRGWEEATRARVVYIVLGSLALGSWAWFRNSVAADQGFVTFAKPIDRDTPLFILGNYGFMALLLAVMAGLNAVFQRMLAMRSS